jgi:CRISPR system Cascade subunit CasC
MLIEIHVVQNHSPANLNRDDLGAPKTCYFGGVLRSRISSQCIKRSIRTSDQLKALVGGVRTRRLPKLIAEEAGQPGLEKKAEAVLQECGFLPKKAKKDADDGGSKMLVYTTRAAIGRMAELLRTAESANGDTLAQEFADLIARNTAVPDMALSGRMLEPDKAAAHLWKHGTTVEASLQVAHAISTHEARPEIDYYVAADDVPGQDAGAGYVDEAMFASACFYKYFSIHWETLVSNLESFGQHHHELAAHTVGAFIRGAALVNPTGKQNSFAAHNPPDLTIVEIKDTPISYANAFADPVVKGERDIISQSIAQLGQYIHDIDTGYGKPAKRFWFSPNLRYRLPTHMAAAGSGQMNPSETFYADEKKSLDELIPSVVTAIGYDWEAVGKVIVNQEFAS